MSGRVHREVMDQLKQTDLLVALGERLAVSTTQGFTFPAAPDPQMPLVHVWPGPEEVGKVFRPELGIACEPAAVVGALLARGKATGASPGLRACRASEDQQAGMAEDERRREFLRRRRRGRPAPEGRRDGDHRRR